MNKKQWIALALLFMVADILFGIRFCIPIRNFAISYSQMADPLSGLSGEELIAVNIQDAMYSSLTWLCYIISFIFFIVAIACFICGWLEKEEAE
ncbi:MAG: hypothetical protein KAT65_05300 [Methanophagales archaeon]|nr:hypothetical protein [Methanophagales archaeon]